MQREQLLKELKELVVAECDTDIAAASIADDAPLMGPGSLLELDSLDALQIALAVRKRYDKRLEGGHETRAALQSINTLADYIQS